MTDTPPAADAASLASTVQDSAPPPAPKTLSELAAAKAAGLGPVAIAQPNSAFDNASAPSVTGTAGLPPTMPAALPQPPVGALTSSSPELASQVTKTSAKYSTEDALASLGACLLTGGTIKDGKIFMEWLKDYTAGV